MKSYAAIDRIEGKYAVCEVEYVNIDESLKLKFSEKRIEMIDIPMSIINGLVGEVKEGDILVVEHEEDEIMCIYNKDDKEKQRRNDIIRKIIENL